MGFICISIILGMFNHLSYYLYLGLVAVDV